MALRGSANLSNAYDALDTAAGRAAFCRTWTISSCGKVLARTTAPIVNISRFAAGEVKNMKNVIACRLGGI
jgi:hypothetical protein